MIGSAKISGSSNPLLNLIAELNGNSTAIMCIEPGFYEIGHFSFEHELIGTVELFPDLGHLSCYGVCDTPQQFIEKYRGTLEQDERTLVTSFTHVKKDGDWRWHKWGPYIGLGNPEHEYLRDEDGFENGVYVYHVYDLKQ